MPTEKKESKKYKFTLATIPFIRHIVEMETIEAETYEEAVASYEKKHPVNFGFEIVCLRKKR